MVQLYNFRWVVEGFLAGSSRPFTQEDLDWLYDKGIRAVVSLSEIPIYQEEIEKRGIVYWHIPVEDYSAPSIKQMKEFNAFVEKMTDVRKPVVAFCDAGLGRTGCMLASYFIAQGYSVSKAVEEVRKTEKQSIDTPAQMQALHDFSLYLNYRGKKNG